jgi:hypothetical protein
MRDISKRLTVINTEKKDNASDSKSQSSGVTYVGFGGGGMRNLNDYLLKSIWDRVWEIRTDSQGTEYIFGKLPVVTQYGITMYSGENMDIPTIAEGLPFDNRTIWFNTETNQIEVIGGTGGGGGGVTSVEPLTIKDSLGQNKVVYDGKEPKELKLTKELVGLDKVDNIPDSDKYVGYARGLKNSKGTLYATYGLVGSDPYNRFGQLGEETWVEGKVIEFLIGGYGAGVAVFRLKEDENAYVSNKLAVGKTTTPNATLDVNGDAIVSGNLTADTFTVNKFAVENGIDVGDVSFIEDEDGNLELNRSMEIDGDLTANNVNATESVNIGGVKLIKIEDGVLKLEGNLLVTGGITSYTNNDVGVSNEVLQTLLDRIGTLESEVEQLKNK